MPRSNNMPVIMSTSSIQNIDGNTSVTIWEFSGGSSTLYQQKKKKKELYLETWVKVSGLILEAL